MTPQSQHHAPAALLSLLAGVSGIRRLLVGLGSLCKTVARAVRVQNEGREQKCPFTKSNTNFSHCVEDLEQSFQMGSNGF